MVVHGRPMKRMKRRVTADLYDFLAFPSREDGSGVALPFRTNVKSFLSKHALLPPPSSLFPHLLTWQILFRVGDLEDIAVSLDVVEEDVARSRSVYCDQCRVVGWSGHPVCSKRYHFIIKADGNSIGGYHKPCTCCGDVLHLLESRCKACNHVTTTDDVEEWVYHQLEDTTHLLHAVVHSNGYGHLLRVNGREGGSMILSGCHIMDFWDRLCKFLGVRKVSVMDVSKKYGLEYRLLHAITSGQPWYGDWGYEFGAGSFALTLDAYKLAIETLSSLKLSALLSQEQKPHTRLQELILFYQSLSDHELVNTRDLFCFLMKLIHDAQKSSPKDNGVSCKKPRVSAPGMTASWSMADVERVEEAMFRVLRAVSGSNWVSSRSLRGAVCRVAPPELLDHCLKEIGGKVAAEGMIVNSRHNPDSGALEYRLEPQNISLVTGDRHSAAPCCPSVVVLKRDLGFFYESMLHPQTMQYNWPDDVREVAVSSAEKLLDCKQFVRVYEPEVPRGNEFVVCVSCQVELVDQYEENAPDPPRELILLPSNGTVSDLKHEVSRAFQDVYLAFRRFQAEELLGYGGVDDYTRVKFLLGSANSVRIRGRCVGKGGFSKFRMERGIERWTVDCNCGAKDDDGERMLACDVCGVWQHTRCSGINDSDAVPARFVCRRCRGPSLTQASQALVQCKEASMPSMAGMNRSGASLTGPYDVRRSLGML